MRNRSIYTSIAIAAIVGIAAMAVWSNARATTLKKGSEGPLDPTPKIAMAYVEDFRKSIPDPFMFTHLIYSFGEFNDALDGVKIKYPEKLQALVDLKKQNPDLKVLISIGGYQKEGFSEMTGDNKKRKAFVKSVSQLVDSLGLDGVDLDWEFPTTDKGGHTAASDDDRNYVKLVKDLRKALGKKKWISYYSLSNGAFIDNKAMLPYVDYVNVSGYNLVTPKEGERLLHQSPLYPSNKIGLWCIKKSVEKMMQLGVPPEKILVGIPFFGRGKKPFPSYLDCNKIDDYAGDLRPQWDEDAQAPYYEDKEGNLVLGFDDERSIAAKMDFIRANNLPGVFVWNYDSDFDDHRLGKTIKKLR